MKRSTLMVAMTMLAVTACTSVDSTEHCVETRYGNVVTEKMPNGLNGTMMTEATCFSMTDQNFPEEGEVEAMAAQTRDPLTVNGEVAITYAYNPATILSVFKTKRSPERAEVEILNAVREGYRNGIAKFTVEELYNKRDQVAPTVQTEIQKKLGGLATVKKVFIRNIAAPVQIEQARIEAAKQAQILDRVRKQFVIDSVGAINTVIKARAEAESKRLQASAYESNSKMLDLDIARQVAIGLSNVCKGVTTCVVGGSIADLQRQGVR